MKKIMFGILLHEIVKNGKYLASIMHDSTIMCDEISESYHEEKKQPVKHNISIFYLHISLLYFLITISLLMVVRFNQMSAIDDMIY